MSPTHTITPPALTEIHAAGKECVALSTWIVDTAPSVLGALQRLGDKSGLGYGIHENDEYNGVFTGKNLCVISAGVAEVAINKRASASGNVYRAETWYLQSEAPQSFLFCHHYITRVPFPSDRAIVVDYTYGQLDPTQLGVLVCCERDITKFYGASIRSVRQCKPKKIEPAALYRLVLKEANQGKYPGISAHDIEGLLECWQ